MDKKRDEEKEYSSREEARSSNIYDNESKRDTEDVRNSSSKMSESIVFVILALIILGTYYENVDNVIPVSYIENNDEHEDLESDTMDSKQRDAIIVENSIIEGDNKSISEFKSDDIETEKMNDTEIVDGLSEITPEEVTEVDSYSQDNQYQSETEVHITEQIVDGQVNSAVSNNTNTTSTKENEDTGNEEMVFKLNATIAKMIVGGVWSARVSYEPVSSYDNFYPYGLSVRWYSSDSSIASVEAYEHNSASGIVKFLSPGEAIITAELDNGLTASAKVICIE